VRSLPQSSPADVARAGGPHIAPLLASIEELLAEVASSHSGRLGEHAAATIAAGGKRLRPLLVILAAGGATAHGVVRAAAAVELVHSATLVHDDVLDAAPLRRGRPTLFASEGRAGATQTGDLLFALAFTLLSESGDAEQVRVLSDAGSALASGELLQRADAWDAAIEPARYLRRCDLKTARLFQAAAELGARNGGSSDEQVAAYAGFGREIGLAFQMLDDVLDVSGPAQRTGKHRGTDLLDGTITLPFIIARERDIELGAIDPRSIRTADQAEMICDRIVATGALDDARARALSHVDRAKTLLPAGLPARDRTALELVADGVVARFA